MQGLASEDELFVSPDYVSPDYERLHVANQGEDLGCRRRRRLVKNEIVCGGYSLGQNPTRSQEEPARSPRQQALGSGDMVHDAHGRCLSSRLK